MANFSGQTFVDKRGIQYVLHRGPKGNLRPYTLGPLKTAMKTRNLWIILATAAVVVVTIVILHVCRQPEVEQSVVEK